MSKTFLEALTSVGKNLQSGIDKLKESNTELKTHEETNLFENYDFASSTGISVVSASSVRADGAITLTLNSSSSMAMSVVFTQGKVDPDHVYYASAKFATPNIANLSHVYIGLCGETWEDDKTIEKNYVKDTNKKFISAIIRPDTTFAENLKVAFGYMRSSSSYSDADEILIIEEPILIDLTATYGSGKEPSKEFIDVCIENSVLSAGKVTMSTSIGTAMNNMFEKTKLNKMGIINAKEKYHLDNTGIYDVTELISQAISELPPNTALYFPAGVYLISGGFVLPHKTGIIGENGREFDNSGTIFKVAPGTSNIKVFSGESTWTTYVYKNFTISSTSYTYSTNEVSSSDNNVQDRYSGVVNDENVVGIECRYGNTIIDNVAFSGLSGVGLDGYIYNYFTNLYFVNCNIPFNIATDNFVENIRIVNCMQGLHINGTANTVNDLRTDGIGTYSLILDENGSENIVGNIEFDQNNWAGIYMNGVMYNYIYGLGGRVGQYYGGFSAENVPTSESYKACEVYIKNSRYNKISITSGYRTIYDSSSEMGPVYKVVSSGECHNNVIDIVGFTAASKGTYIENSYSQNSGTPMTIDEVKEVIKPIDGTFNGIINYNGKKLVVMIDNGEINLTKTSCNGITCYNTSDVAYVTPEYIGQLITYNDNLYIAISLALGGWLNLTALQS